MVTVFGQVQSPEQTGNRFTKPAFPILLLQVLCVTVFVAAAQPALAATFGKTTVGGTTDTDGYAGFLGATKFTSPADAGTLTDLTVYTNASDVDVCVSIYTDSAGYPDTKITDGCVAGGLPWGTVSVSASLSPNTDYWLVFGDDDGGYNYNYDAGAANQFVRAAGGSFPTHPATFPGGGTYFSREYSIYATYTPANVCTVTTTNDGGAGSLRQCIIDANASPGSDMIVVPAGVYTLTIPGTGEDAAATGDLDITDAVGTLTITGAGAGATIIDANGIDRVFDVTAGVSASLEGFTITNGAGTRGGGIQWDEALSLTNIVVTGNRPSAEGGALYCQSGSCTLSFTNSSMTGNSASKAGGIWIKDSSGTVTITDSTIADNTATGDTGGIFLEAVTGAVDLNRVTISGNAAADKGGGIYFKTVNTVDMINITVSGNVSGNSAGGIFNEATALTLTNATITGNTANPGEGGGLNHKSGSATVKNTIIANNPAGGDCAGSPTSAGNNLESDGTCGFALTGDPLLGPLADNGGPTQTHALSAGSMAIDAGTSTGAPVVDQRGAARPVDGDGDLVAVTDIGAYEYNPAADTCPIVTSTGDSGPGTLRDCIDYANLNPGTTISFNIPVADPGYTTSGVDSWWRIQVDVGLPELTANGTVIDGTTQTLNRGDTNSLGPEIELTATGSNQKSGLVLFSADNMVKGLIIGGFGAFNGQGIDISEATATGNIITGNYIGTDHTGTGASPNLNGIYIYKSAASNTIGGTGPGEANVIAFNTSNGLWVADKDTDFNRISGNSIFGNGDIGIDLKVKGVSPNDPGDADDGPNEELNFPVISEVLTSGADYVVTGSVGSGSTVQFFRANNPASPAVAVDPTGYGEGYLYLATAVDLTEGGATDADPAAGLFRFTLPGGDLAQGDWISSTAIDTSGNTSEFSLSYRVPQALVKRAFLASDGSPINDSSTLPRGTVFRFMIYLDNEGPAIGDVSVQDVLDPAFAYSTGSLKVDNSVAVGASVQAIYASVNGTAPLTDTIDADVASITGSTIDVGNQTVANGQLDIAANRVWALLFTVRMQ